MAASGPVLHEQCVLSFSATKLPSMDLTSKSDPMLVVYAIDSVTKQLTRVARTEYIMNNEDPTWTKTFQTDFFFEREQKFRIEAYDIDGTDNGALNVNVTGFDYMGHCDFLLSQVMSAFNCTLSIQLTDKNNQPVHQAGMLTSKSHSNRSLIHIRGDQLVKTRNKLYFDVVGSELSKGGFFGGKPDTELQLVKPRPDGTEFVVWNSSMVYENVNPTWGGGKVDMGQLVDGGDPASQQAFVVRVVRIKGGNREVIGQASKRFADIRPGVAFPITAEKNKEKGHVTFRVFRVEEEYTFLDYIQGLDFQMTLCLDFTGSNGNPADNKSLHYIHPGCRNQYIDSIRSIGTILANYCQKSVFPVVGFGGFVSIDGRPQDNSHCFPLSLDSSRPFCNGVEDIVQTYCTSLPRITLSGPTLFEHIIRSGTTPALRPYTPDYQHYQIILIITDGCINDFGKTVDAIIDAAKTPTSIIIVGVGNADFSAMSQLDGDEVRLKSPTKGEVSRDIVQFVPFLQFMNNPIELAHQTLAEIPTQVQEFMAMNKIKPIQRQQAPAPYNDNGPK